MLSNNECFVEFRNRLQILLTLMLLRNNIVVIFYFQLSTCSFFGSTFKCTLLDNSKTKNFICFSFIIKLSFPNTNIVRV